MADMMSTLKGILGDGAEDKIQNALEMLKKNGLIESEKPSGEKLSDVAKEINSEIQVAPKKQETGLHGALTPEGLEFANQIRNIFNKISNTNDKRSDLLRSLKPFMRTERQQAIDRAIKIINISRFSGIFGNK